MNVNISLMAGVTAVQKYYKYDSFQYMNRLRFVINYLLIVLVFWFWYQSTTNVLYDGRFWPYESSFDLIRTFLLNYPMLLFMCVLNTLIVFKMNWPRGRSWRIVVDFILSGFGVPLIVNGIFLLISFMAGKVPKVMWPQTFVLNVLIFTINEMLWFVINYQKARRLATEMEYNALRAQVNPHFLFNSLNILYSLIHIDQPKSQDFVLALSGMYRYISKRRNNKVVNLESELEFLDSYIRVLKMVYFETFDIMIDDKRHNRDEELIMIPYSLQLLLENVTKHNVISEQQPMYVLIEITNKQLIMTNNYQPRQQTPKLADSTGVGLSYLKKLYHLNGRPFEYGVCDDKFRVCINFIN